MKWQPTVQGWQNLVLAVMGCSRTGRGNRRRSIC